MQVVSTFLKLSYPQLDLTATVGVDDAWPTACGMYSDVYRAKAVLDADTAFFWDEALTAFSKDDRRSTVDCVVAVKRFRFHLDEGVLGKFRTIVPREIGIWVRLKHRNVLPLLGFILEKNGPALVAPWMDNGTIGLYVREQKNESSVLCAVRGIASGLSYLHSLNIVHSDLKCANILVSPSGTPLLTDFGLSQILHDAGSPQPPDSPAGSMRWMAIELIEANAERADASFAHWQTKASDIWAFGMTVCELVTQSFPYAHLRSDVEVLFAILKHELPGATAWLPSPVLDTAGTLALLKLWSLCIKCWKRHPPDRPTAEDIAKELQCILSLQSDVLDMFQAECDISYSQTPSRALTSLATSIRHGEIKMDYRIWHGQACQNTFTGAEFVDWILRTFKGVETRERAIIVGQRMVECGYVKHYLRTDEHMLRDDHYLHSLTDS